MNETSIKKNSFINLIKTIVGLIFPLVTFPYASRILGVENIGRINFANSIINYFILFAGLGISNYAIREGAKIRDDRAAISQFCSEMLMLNIISTLTSYICLFFILRIPLFQSYKNLMILFSTTIFFNVIGINWFFYIYEDFIYISIRTILFQIISLVLLLFYVRNQESYMVYAGILVFSSVGSNIFNIFYAKRFIDFFPKVNYNLRKHIKSIIIIFGMSLASTIYLNLDITMLGLQSGDYEVGLYTAATKISKMASTIISSVCVVFLPRLAYYVKMNRIQDFCSMVDTAFYYILGLTIPAATGMLVLSKEIIILFSGKAFLEALPAMMIKAPNIILSVLNGFIAVQLFMPLNKEKISLYATLIGAVINCFLNYILIPKWGATGAALATIFAEESVFLTCLFHLKGIYPLKNLLEETRKYLLGSLGILIIGLLMRELIISLWVRTILIIIFSTIIYFSILYYLNSVHMTYLKQLIKKYLK